MLHKKGGRRDLNPRPSEPQTDALPLSYIHHKSPAPRGIRTPDLRIRSPLLYPAELLAHL